MVDGLARWLNGTGFPPGIKNKEARAPYLYMLIRANPDKVRWWTPEEWNLLESQRVSLRLMLREK